MEGWYEEYALFISYDPLDDVLIVPANGLIALGVYGPWELRYIPLRYRYY